jgi:predicted nucleic acid-binding protein
MESINAEVLPEREKRSMTTSRELAALDTNVLIYALYADTEHHRAARLLVDQARSSNAALCFTPQVLAEFYAVVTNPRRGTEAKSPEAVPLTSSPSSTSKSSHR